MRKISRLTQISPLDVSFCLRIYLTNEYGIEYLRHHWNQTSLPSLLWSRLERRWSSCGRSCRSYYRRSYKYRSFTPDSLDQYPRSPVVTLHCQLDYTRPEYWRTNRKVYHLVEESLRKRDGMVLSFNGLMMTSGKKITFPQTDHVRVVWRIISTDILSKWTIDVVEHVLRINFWVHRSDPTLFLSILRAFLGLLSTDVYIGFL